MKLTKSILTFLTVLSSMQLGAVAPDAVERDYQARKQAVGDDSYFVMADTLSDPVERRYMRFLYAYMPLPDIIDYPAQFYLDNVRQSIKTAKEMPWGKLVPEREFMHFVLPVRVNNEHLDSARTVFYDELKGRLAGLSMSDAVLEVNHWLHEKATYQPSDSRTSTPLSTVSQAIGRCGEESTFGVAALRSVGIPARQVYTPRWAHTDDNHAWVEAWADGKWHFLGACEPEPVLDLGWFNEPASRGMMMNTQVFGAYDGPEEVLVQNPVYTSINVTSNYAPVDNINVSVVDADGKPVEAATVNFSLYNYAEYYPIGIKKTDKEGHASLLTGIGDLVIYAYKDGRFGMVPASVGRDKTVTVPLTFDASTAETFEWTLTPPAKSATLPVVTPDQVDLNNRRKAAEDSIRNAYTSTFANEVYATLLAHKLGIDRNETVRLLTLSRGNHAMLSRFLESLDGNKLELEKAMKLLGAVTEKDLRDISPEVLADNMSMTPASHGEIAVNYILNPRISNEHLTPYKRALLDSFDPATAARFKDDAAEIEKWVRDSIEIETTLNPLKLKTSPIATRNLKKGNEGARDILFVALCRTFGHPARIDGVTGKTQVYNNGDWTDIKFSPDAVQSPKGMLKITYESLPHLADPTYYTHFSISRIMPDGSLRLQEYPEEATCSSLFSEPTSVDAGQYLMTSGQRLADGSVLARSVIFSVDTDKTTEIPLVIRQDTTALQVIGSLNAENLYSGLDGNVQSLLATSGRGYYIVALLNANHEPSIHAINDIIAASKELEECGRTIFLLLPDAEAAAATAARFGKNLPSNVVIGVDNDGAVAAEIAAAGESRPVVVVADTFNRVIFKSEGYTINLGTRLAEILNKVSL